MISVILDQIIKGNAVLQKISNIPMKAKTGFKIAKILKVITPELECFNKGREELLMKYGVRDEDGQFKKDEKGNIYIKTDMFAECNEDFAELLSTKVELNAEKINIDELEAAELTPTEINEISWMIEDF